MPDLLDDLLANGPFARADAPYRLVKVSGPDAGDFLQRLCSQDVLGIAAGQVRPAALLDAKGKLLVTCLVFRRGGSFWLEVQAEQCERLLALLERYHFTEQLAIAPPAVGACHELVGRAATAAGGGHAAEHGSPRVHFERRGVAFTRSYGEPVAGAAAARPLTEDRAECLRLFAGLVRVGVETEPTTLALEADLDDHVSTTKGCYTGQEIVARIHTYGHVNRRLCLLRLGAGDAIRSPAPLHETETGDRLAVGRVMYAVPIPGHDARLGAGYLPKDFQALGTRLALADGGPVEVVGYGPLPGLPA